VRTVHDLATQEVQAAPRLRTQLQTSGPSQSTRERTWCT